MKDNIDLIKCGDHSLAPWHLVCVHLLTRPKQVWESIPLGDDDGRDVESDYVCSDCLNKVEETGNWDAVKNSLRCACMHCIREIRAQHDENYQEFEV